MKRLRRWLAGLLLVVLGLGALAWWRFARDAEALTRTLVAVVESGTGLQLVTQAPGEFDLWPRISLRIAQAELRNQAATVARVDGFAIVLPWRSLFGGERRIDGLRADRLELDADAIASWAASRSDDGPPLPLSWPRLDAEIHVDHLLVAGMELRDLVMSPLGNERALSLDAVWPQAADSKRPPLNLVLRGTTRERDGGLAVDPVELRVDDAGAEVLRITGRFAWQDASRQAGSLQLTATTPPAWLDPTPLRIEAMATALQFELDGAMTGPLSLSCTGRLAGEPFDAKLVLPADWMTTLSESPLRLAEQATGELSLSRLRTDAAEIDGFTWRNPAPQP
jgi:hypothetical protein